MLPNKTWLGQKEFNYRRLSDKPRWGHEGGIVRIDKSHYEKTMFPLVTHPCAGRIAFWFRHRCYLPIFCGLMVLQLIRVETMVVETRGMPLELVQNISGSDEN